MIEAICASAKKAAKLILAAVKEPNMKEMFSAIKVPDIKEIHDAKGWFTITIQR